MNAKCRIAAQNWEFDGQAFTIRIPVTWKHRGGRKVIVASDGGDMWAPTNPRQDETLIRALARAHRWKRLLDEGSYTAPPASWPRPKALPAASSTACSA